jgi:quinol monooxygenase YgiN
VDGSARTDGVGRLGAILQMTAKPGHRDALLQILSNYAGTLDGEPGTLLFAVSADPNDEDTVFLWEEFVDGNAVQAHFEHDFFRALQLELADLLAEPAAARPLVPIARRLNPNVAAE